MTKTPIGTRLCYMGLVETAIIKMPHSKHDADRLYWFYKKGKYI
jgi:hypothetical protein